jgi:hypothetical protein
MPQRARTRDEVLPIYIDLMIVSIYGTDRTYEKYGRDIKQECTHCIRNQNRSTNGKDFLHGDGRYLPYQRNNTIHNNADRGKIVERDKRIHLVLSTIKQFLDQDEPNRFEDDGSTLIDESCQYERDLSETCKHDTEHYEGDVEQDSKIRLSHTHYPSS